MLKRLTISNIALLDKLSIGFEEGFSALTGETGAGKSILIESVGFALGERAYRESIRTGESKAFAEAVFCLAPDSPAMAFLQERSLENGEEAVLYRELSLTGRNVCRINGTMVSAGELKALGDLLVDMHGQHAHQSLLDEGTHLGLLDAFANSDGDGLLKELASVRDQALSYRAQREKLQKSLRERERRLGVIAYELKEISAAELQIGEEEKLLQEKKKLQNFAVVQESLEKAYNALYGDEGALNGITEARRALESIASYDETFSKAKEQLEEGYYPLEDATYSLRDALNALTYDPNALESIESRLFLIEQLKRKYGVSIEAILAYQDSIIEERQRLQSGEERIETLLQQEQKALAAFKEKAEALSGRRKEAAVSLKKAIEENLRDMGMPYASFSAGFTNVPSEELNENGIDEVSFLFSANKGEPEKPLAKVASGGEISRVMLAFKVALAKADRIDTLIFDEIDTGISGLIANAVARKMRALSREHQVLCVTHLAQIAAHADRQYYIYKETGESSTRSMARLLTEEERPGELARIMGSEGDESALEHARTLLSAAKAD